MVAVRVLPLTRTLDDVMVETRLSVYPPSPFAQRRSSGRTHIALDVLAATDGRAILTDQAPGSVHRSRQRQGAAAHHIEVAQIPGSRCRR